MTYEHQHLKDALKLRDTLTQKQLKEFLDYDKETGSFYRKVSQGSAKVGSFAGGVNGYGYIRISINCRCYLAHRLAWLWVYGSWPINNIDHIDHNPLNNRICNLRDTTKSENAQNQIKARIHNGCGKLGVSFFKRSGKFRATITLNGKWKHLGYFTTAEKAHTAYLAKKRELHPANTI